MCGSWALDLGLWPVFKDLTQDRGKPWRLCTQCHYGWAHINNQEVTQMAAQNPSVSADTAGTENDLVTESLVEEVSIDGMCGVY